MSLKQNKHQPQKLTAFFTQPVGERRQDGTATSAQQGRTAYTDLSDAAALDTDSHGGAEVFPQSPPTSSVSISLAKARMRLEVDPLDPDVSHPPDTTLPQPPPQSSIASFPTTNQPVLDTTMKEMLLSLQSSLYNDYAAMFNRFTTEMHAVENGIYHIE